MTDYVQDLYIRVQGSPGKAPSHSCALSPCTGFPGCLQCTEQPSRQPQIWNITVKHVGDWAVSEQLWTGTATGETEFCLCFQKHKESQDQPKYQYMT